MQRILLILLVPAFGALLAPLPGFTLNDGVAPRHASRVLPVDEELEYEVSWTFVDLGTIRLKATRGLAAEARIDSYEGLPYVDLHAFFQTVMDTSFMPLVSRSLEKQDGRWDGLQYAFDIPARRFEVRAITGNSPMGPFPSMSSKDTVAIPEIPFVDGLSIGYYPRRIIHLDRSVQVSTILYGRTGTTTFYLPGEREEVDIDAVDYPIRTIRMEGNTTAVGIFGMSGDFVGWFSDDEAAVPIRGRVNVLLGSITIQLVKWNRPGWNPPQ
jgi:hypothetical protein